MSSISTFLPACLFGSGMASISWGATRFPDTGFKTLGAALLVAGFPLSATPALADQFVEAADNAKIDCTLSRDELTRIALVGDEFSSVSKIASGYPYNDFGVTHEPVRGDIYISPCRPVMRAKASASLPPANRVLSINLPVTRPL